MRKKNLIFVLAFIVTFAFFTLCLAGCSESARSTEAKLDELQVLISVKRTGNILTGIGKMSVFIDDEEVFDVSNNSTESVKITMTEGVHTIQTKGQGDKSKKKKFKVVSGEKNEFYFTSEISNWWGIKLEERKYISKD